MEVEVDPRKSPQDNAAVYYERSKKLRAKIAGLEKAIDVTRQLIEKEKQKIGEREKPVKRIAREKEWYEAFHWFYEGGKLVLGGKDAKSNQVLVKRYLEKNDLFFHADVVGAPAVILKNGQEASDEEKQRTAVFAASFSRAWKAGAGTSDVYAVTPENVKTAAKPGEYLPKGGFVITGKREWFKSVELELAVAFIDGKIAVAPAASIKGKFLRIRPNPRESKGESAKKMLSALKAMFPEAEIDVDWVLQVLPNGGSRIVR